MGVGDVLGLWISGCNASVAFGILGVLGTSVTSGRAGASARIVGWDMVMRAGFGGGAVGRKAGLPLTCWLFAIGGLPGVLGASVAGLW